MKKSNVDKILVEQAKRRRNIFAYSCLIVAFFILSSLFIFLYLYSNRDEYIKYDEDSSINYRVYLKENEFFEEEYLGKDKSYIASLIDYIDTNFYYTMALQDQSGDFKYAYRIEAEIDVKERNGSSSLYNFKEELLKRTEKGSNGSSSAIISENIIIDYNHYNDLIKSFVKTYSLDDTISTITIRMYVNILGTCENFDENLNNESVMSIEIPLTRKTMNIEISNDLIETEDNIMACNKSGNKYLIFLLFGSVMILVNVFYVVLLLRYVVKTRTAEDIYHKELKKILNNYHSYIQKINNEFDVSKYQKLKVDSFTDMLEIRDTLQQPILMVENKQKDGVYFIIPSNTRILYTYGLKLSDIKEQMQEKEEQII